MRLMRFVLLALTGVAAATLSACTQMSVAEPETGPAQIEPVGETGLNKITLTERAAERIGIETEAVAKGPVAYTLVTIGAVERLSGSSGGLAIRVALSPNDFARIDTDQAVSILPRADSDTDAIAGRLTREEQAAGYGDATVFYAPSSDAGLAIGQRARVVVPLRGSGSERLTVPYRAVLYDDQGQAWVYTNPDGHVYVRAPVTVDRIDGATAVLADGPAPGTMVVTEGVTELYGAEVGVGE